MKENKAKTTLAPSDSLLGMLQRGRGLGALMTRNMAPESVWPLLIECITRDPRLDRQCENRAGYYAKIILQTGMKCGSIRQHLQNYDHSDASTYWEISLALSTLCCLSEYGHQEAIQILKEYVSYGAEWDYIICHLAGLYPSDNTHDIDKLLCKRLAQDPEARGQFKSEVMAHWQIFCEDPDRKTEFPLFLKDSERRMELGLFLPICEPWKTFCLKNKELAAIFAELNFTVEMDIPDPPREEAFPDPMDLTLPELFHWAGKIVYWKLRVALECKVTLADESLLLENLNHKHKCGVALAFEGLGILGTPEAFATVKLFLENSEHADGFHRRYAFEAFADMPPELTLETARQWFLSDSWYLQVAAGGVFENHATVDDVPLLVDVLRSPQTLAREDCRLSFALESLAQCDGIGHIPEIEAVFCGTQSCYDRYRAAVAMETTAPHVFRHQFAFECLRDCHWYTRGFACQEVSLSGPGVLEALKEIADDPCESERVRSAAQERLDEF